MMTRRMMTKKGGGEEFPFCITGEFIPCAVCGRKDRGKIFETRTMKQRTTIPSNYSTTNIGSTSRSKISLLSRTLSRTKGSQCFSDSRLEQLQNFCSPTPKLFDTRCFASHSIGYKSCNHIKKFVRSFH